MYKICNIKVLFRTVTSNLLFLKLRANKPILFLTDCWHITSSIRSIFFWDSSAKFLRPISYYHLSPNILELKMPACPEEYRLKSLKLEGTLQPAWLWVKVCHETSCIFPKLFYFPTLHILVQFFSSLIIDSSIHRNSCEGIYA